MNIRKQLTIASVAILSALFVSSCSKDGKSQVASKAGKATMKFNLTDAPASYDAVNIDIQEVRVHISNSPDTTVSNGWITMQNIQPGIYNLLDFQNGLDTLIASGTVPAGTVSQIRLILGPNNEVVVNGVPEPLKTPSAQQSGLKLQVNYNLQAGVVYEFWLDFDASRSIVAKGNGGYNLKPVIRVFTKQSEGSIDGYVSPVAAHSSVLAYNVAGDSATAMSDTVSGYFLISGLNPNTYTVEFDPIAPYTPTDTMGVNVLSGAVTHLDTIAIQ